MEKRDEIIKSIRKRLNEKRFTHSVNTAKEAVLLADKYGADKEKAYIAGLLHDVAKGLSSKTLMRIAEDNGIEIDEYEKLNPELMHGKAGAAIAKNEYDISDEEILSAIRWHTTGHKNMTLLEKIIYIADIIEPGRDFPQTDMIRQTAYENMDLAVLTALKHVMRFVKSRGLSLHPCSIEAYEFLKMREENKGLEV